MLEEESGVLKHSVSIFVVEVFVVFLNCICQTKSLAVISACVYFKGSVIIGELLGNLAIDITLWLQGTLKGRDSEKLKNW